MQSNVLVRPAALGKYVPLPWRRLRTLCGNLGIVVCVGLVCAGHLAAQSHPDTAAHNVGASGIGLGSDDPSADTGRMVPAHISQALHPTAGQCIVAMQTVQHRATRQLSARRRNGGGPFIEVELPVGGRLPVPSGLKPDAMATGRACVQRLTIATAPATTLPDFFVLALLLQNDTLAQAVIHQQLMLAPNSSERAALLASAFAAVLGTSPVRQDLATFALRQLDTVSNAWIERFYTRKALRRMAATPAAKMAYEDTLVDLSTHFTPASLEQWTLATDVFDLYGDYLSKLRPRAATDATVAATYRKVRERYLTLGTQLKTASALDAERRKALDNVPALP